MRILFYIISLVFLVLSLSGCDLDDSKMRTASLTSPNSQDVRDFTNWGSSDSVQAFNGVQVIAQNQGKTLLMTCPTNYVLLIQSNVANSSEVTKRCDAQGGCEAIVVEAVIDGSTSEWLSGNETFDPGDIAGTANNLNEDGVYASGITCVKKDDFSKWS